MLVQRLGKGFGETVGQRLKQDVGIIVLVGKEARRMGIDPVDADGKAADPVAVGVDEIGKTHVGAVAALLDLLAQEGKAHVFLGLGQVDGDIIPVARAGPQPGDAARGEPLFGNDLIEHRIGIGEQLGRGFADHFVGEDRGVIAVQFPGAEERRPVDEFAQVGKVPVGEDVEARLLGRRGLVRQEGVVEIGPCLFQGQKDRGRLARARIAHMGVFIGDLGDVVVALGVGEKLGGNAHRPARVEHVDHRAFIGRVDLQGGVDLRSGRPADQQRHGHARTLHFLGDGHHLVQRGRDEAR